MIVMRRNKKSHFADEVGEEHNIISNQYHTASRSEFAQRVGIWWLGSF